MRQSASTESSEAGRAAQLFFAGMSTKIGSLRQQEVVLAVGWILSQHVHLGPKVPINVAI
jgi:hypothetical protein